EEGFIHIRRADELVPAWHLSGPVGALVPRMKEKSPRLSGSSSTRARKSKGIPQIDLHAERLSHIPPGVLPGEILKYQLRALEMFIRRMKQTRTSKFLVIHGKGTGKLRKAAIRAVRKAGYRVYDAGFDEMGGGAFFAEHEF
ncbi:MAG: Smr/MutS family protein, partial [Chlorobi bacterium]|nr:Smr/MutS family protein [Chlorobiota bacterium]